MTTMKLRHHSSVTHMRQVEDHLLMVGGLEDSVLSLLDVNRSLSCMTCVIQR
jgi:hypothetical protein